MKYSVGQLARLAGVSVRTIHHYGSIGLLEPESVRANGYHEYGEASLLRLQQVLLHKELGLSLSEIKKVLDQPGFDLIEALESHRESLKLRLERLETIVKTVENTIARLKGVKHMTDKNLFAGLTKEQEERYAKEAETLYDPKIVRASNAKWKSRSKDEQKAILDEGNKIYQDFASLIDKDPSSPEVLAVVERWRRHIEYFWTPNLDQLLGLADLYNNDPRFRDNFDRIDPRLSGFVWEAVKAYVKSVE